MSELVLDASAVLALLASERGAEEVANTLGRAAISAVNLAEVVSKLSERGVSQDEIDNVLSTLSLHVIPFDAEQARIVGALRPLTRLAGLSLGDRACLALAQVLGVPAWTADTAWAGLSVGVSVVLVR